MSQDSKFQQRWEFRRREEDSDPSSNGEASSGNCGPFLKKNKLVPNLISLENDDAANTQFSPPENQQDGGTTATTTAAAAAPFQFEDTEKFQAGPSKKKREVKNKEKKSPPKKPRKKKNTSDRAEAAEALPLDGLKSFVKSIINDLKVDRENMFTRMKEDMESDKSPSPAPKAKRKAESSVKKVVRRPRKKKVVEVEKTLDCNGAGTSEQPAKNDKPTAELNNSTENIQERVNHEPPVAPATNESGEKTRLTTEKSTMNQLVSSSHLDVATVPPEPRPEHNDLISPYKYSHGGPRLGKSNLGFDPSAHQRHFPSFSQPGQSNLGYFGQTSNVLGSSQGNSFAIQIQQALRSGISIPSSLGHSSTENNLLGLRMNGGGVGTTMRYSEGDHAFTDQFISSNSRGQMNYNGDGLLGFGNQEPKERHLYSN